MGNMVLICQAAIWPTSLASRWKKASNARLSQALIAVELPSTAAECPSNLLKMMNPCRFRVADSPK
jgi:hypothetical protein